MFLIAALGAMLLAMAAFRTPVIALMPDLVPSTLRSKVKVVINLTGGLGGVLAFLVVGVLYGICRPLAFWVGGAIALLIAVAILY